MSLREVNYLKWLKDLHSRRILRPNLLDDSGLSQVHHCAYRGFLSCLKWLAKHGGSLASSSAEGSSAAHYAAAGGHLEVLQWIYRRSSRSVVFRDHNGATPLYFAAQEGHLDCLEWLTKRTTTVHSEASIDGMTAVHASAQEGHLECLVFLIQCAGCSGLARDKAGCIPMHFAAAGGHRTCVNWLSLHGWGTGNERNKVGSSPLHVASEHGHLEVVKLLMRSGAKADLYDRHGRTAYDIAVETGNEACAQFLLQASHKALNGMVANVFVHQSSLKRVRFERKAIEKGIRDSNPNLTESQTLEAVNQSHYSQARGHPDRIQRSRSLVYPSYESYRDATRLGIRTYSTSNLNNNSSSHSNSINTSNRVSLTNYLSNFDSSLTPSLEGISRNGPTPPVRSHRPIQRTYSAPAPDVHSDAVEEASDRRAGVGVSRSQSMRPSMFSGRPFRFGASRDQYDVSEVTNNDTSTFRPNVSSLLTALKNKATKPKEQEIPSESAPYNPKDLIPFPVESNDLNIFRRLYRMSKRKLTRTTSLSINDEDYMAKPREKQDQFLVTGSDNFIPGSSVHYEEPVMTSQLNQANGHHGHVHHDTFHGQETVNGREIVSYQQRPLSTDFTLENIRTKMRDNALIW